MRDEMANLAWAIERTVESPIEQPAQRYEARGRRAASSGDLLSDALPRYLLSTQVPPNWIPLLPVQVPNPLQPNTPGQILSRLKRGAVLQPDGTTQGPRRARRGAAVDRRTVCSTTRRCRARARASRASAGWRAGPTARRGCGRRSATRSDRAKARALEVRSAHRAERCNAELSSTHARFVHLVCFGRVSSPPANGTLPGRTHGHALDTAVVCCPLASADRSA